MAMVLTFQGGGLVMAQDNPPPPKPGGMGGKMFEGVSPADKEKFMAARKKAMADNPDLLKEQDALRAEGEAIRDGTSQETFQEFGPKMKAHEEKVRAAMLKEDSTLQPIFDQIDKNRAAMRGQWKQKQGDGGTPPPPPPGQ